MPWLWNDPSTASAPAGAFNPLLFAGFAAMILFAIRPPTAWLAAAVVLSWGVLRNV